MTHLINRHSGERIWLVDASIYVFRAWFVRTPMPLDRNGNPINAVRGFLNFTYQLLYEQSPQYIAFAFDISLLTSVRKQLYPDYKAHRTPAPEELKYQFQLCREFLSVSGIVQAASEHHEADDVLGTWTQQQRTTERQMVIISADKDLAQLVANDDIWWDYGRRKALNAGGIKNELGVWPDQIADQLAIAGDKADNIPGIPGVGMATAAKLLKRFGSLDQVLANMELIEKMQITGAKRLRSLVEKHQDIALLARQLTTIDCNVPDVPQDLRRTDKDLPRLEALFDLLQLSDLQRQLWRAI